MDKRALVEQLVFQLRQAAAVAQRASQEAATMARDGATPAEKREDGRVALEHQSLAVGQTRRADKARAELAALETFRPPPLPDSARIAVGAIVELELEGGYEGRTIFFAPAGAGVELTVPGGDGFLSVVTPSSPIGRAIAGGRVGDTVEVTVDGEVLDWRITFVG